MNRGIKAQGLVEDIKGYYDEAFFTSMARAYSAQTPWTKLRLAQVQRMANPQPGDRIIDLGCGMGSVTNFCASQGANVVGIDVSEVGIKQARTLFSGARITFLVRNVASLDGLENESFDKAVCFDLVEHISQDTYDAMAREAYRVLKPGGILCIYTPNPTHVIERLKARNLILKQHPTHIDLKPTARLTRTLTNVGFNIDLLYYTPSFIRGFNLLERLLQPLPVIGSWFRYRTCVRAVKPM